MNFFIKINPSFFFHYFTFRGHVFQCKNIFALPALFNGWIVFMQLTEFFGVVCSRFHFYNAVIIPGGFSPQATTAPGKSIA